MNKSESKYFNTALLMDNALISLLEKKDFQYISVKEICRKAGVNRSTFYLHYETIGDLLEEATEYFFNRFYSSFDKNPGKISEQIDTAPLEELILINNDYLIPYLNFIKEHKAVFNAFLSNPECMKSRWHYSEMKRHIFKPILGRFNIPQNLQNYLITYYINGTIAVIKEWVSGNCKESVGEIAEIIISCVRPYSGLDGKTFFKQSVEEDT